ncbi:hypothetical protein OG800_49865 (plasmid) [Streptomyces sp. NBC_00445]|uniref:hypothetical protein n=1 Tax=Streptomyces sp. NBC_00445 TaxID=2975745 RepID=UPI002E1D8C62
MNIAKTLAASAVTASLLGATVALATPASALSWKCSTSSKSIDDAGYWGPVADNWSFKVTNCAARSGSYAYAKSTIRWDAPWYYSGATETFDGAKFRVYIKRASTGSVLRYATYDIQHRLEHSDASGNGSWTTPTISKRVGSSRAYGDGTLKLDWNNDGAGYRNYGFTGSRGI